LRGQAAAGERELAYLDESGFAPTLPTGHTWAKEGVRPLVRHEYPAGRRVHAVGALVVRAGAKRLVVHTRTARLDAPAVLDFIWRDLAGLPAPPAALPPDHARPVPLTVVVDNYAVHRSRLFRDATPALERAGVTLFYLPPYSPELNLIEPEWRHLKYEGVPVRSHDTADALKCAVDHAVARRAAHLAQPTTDS
jgi:hypothetical protein